ncbi:hypothetical protein HPP92_018314 [Vanilla planifolia]|uniref:Uncharacterized protein n=1 Tax=Vanilla planifolia TaxID=51239 RepID=A0A835URF0_VANPL|nr:hypothetical protein HPP92_018940 [Vanilla planifolia]KAG0468986.1 hypothetical protein HPP92_018314 [Vanilla planifolia]
MAEAPTTASRTGLTAKEPLEGPGAGASAAMAAVTEAVATRRTATSFFISMWFNLDDDGLQAWE